MPRKPWDWIKRLGFKDVGFSFGTLRNISHTYGQGADIGECLETSDRIIDGDFDSWNKEWRVTAERVEKIAIECERKGHKRSAQEAYFRASNYYRACEFYVDKGSEMERVLEISRKSTQCFQKGLKFSEFKGEPIKMPYEGSVLHGYYFESDSQKGKAPLLISHSGFDSPAEECFFVFGISALKRGYDCILFDGPGQGKTIREENLVFRPDWEVVITAVVDYAQGLPRVDQNKIAYYASSFGGYLAPRAVCFENRIKACIANGGLYDYYEAMLRFLPPDLPQYLDSNPAEFDKKYMELCKANTLLKWLINDGKWKFGVSSPSEFFLVSREYTLKNIIDQIKTPMLVMESEGEHLLPGQSRKVYDKLKGPKEWMLFTTAEGAEAHCQMGASAVSTQRMYDWLDEFFKR